MRIVDVVPTTRVLKATRCRHCAFCRPRGAGSGVCLCIEPSHAGAVVVGDMIACGDCRPAVRVPDRDGA